MSKTTIAVAVSGGQDSMLALSLLREQGHEVFALHAFFLPPDERLRLTASKLGESCASLGIALHVVDLSESFERMVVAPFIRDYAAGRTPNPCAQCNRHLKFGLLLDAARELGAQCIATGHYARLEAHPEFGTTLCAGADRSKDQSYFLALVERRALARAVFPLASWRKKDVMEALDVRCLPPPLPSESQEVCFIPGDDYKVFLQGSNAPLGGPGPVFLTDGTEVGQHQGLWRYTLGQRRGLGIAWKHPLYVVSKDVRRNSLLVGTAEEMRRDTCRVEQLNFLVPPHAWPEACREICSGDRAGILHVKTRYRQRPSLARAELQDDHMVLRFEQPEFPPTPGQVAVLYTADGMVLAGGVISEKRL